MLKPVKAYRLVTFIPPEFADKFAEKIAAAIPNIGADYDGVCWYGEAGTEQFRPLPGARPKTGKTGKLTRTPSVRLEFTLPADDLILENIIKNHLLPHHPWEKPVILVFDHILYL